MGYALWPELEIRIPFKSDEFTSMGYALWPELPPMTCTMTVSLPVWDMRSGRNHGISTTSEILVYQYGICALAGTMAGEYGENFEFTSMGYALWPEPEARKHDVVRKFTSMGYALWPELPQSHHQSTLSLPVWGMRSGRNSVSPTHSRFGVYQYGICALAGTQTLVCSVLSI